MAKQSSVQITCKIDGDGVDSRIEPPASVNATAPSGGPHQVVLAAGENIVTPPPGTKGVIVTPGTAAGDLNLRGNSGETGIFLDATQSSALALDVASMLAIGAGGAPGFIINSLGGGTVFLTFT